ncbi:hypothetical protein ACQ856_05575 [Mycolicibacterium psychrotolerans]|uniref:hypothetical protein n=1 Tax=Mycolicibacterium psychrotolerans TaxID=216929 RepID=UPI003D667F1C
MTEVFLGREGLAGGLSRHDLQRWYRQMYRGVYVPKYATPSVRDRALGAWLYTDRTGVIGGVAASALHGAQWVDDDVAIEVLVGERRRQPGLIVRMDRVSDDEVTTVDGLPVTTIARTAFDLGRHQKRAAALARLDALMRVAPICSESVELIMKRYGPVRGVRQLRELLPLIDIGAASPQESWLRLLLIDGGLPAPETQIPVLDGGVPIAYLDMGYRDLKLAFEYDGDQHRSDRRQYVRDIRRIPMLERLGWEVIRVIAEDRPAEVLWRAKEAYLRRGGAEIDEMTRSTRTFAA